MNAKQIKRRAFAVKSHNKCIRNPHSFVIANAQPFRMNQTDVSGQSVSFCFVIRINRNGSYAYEVISIINSSFSRGQTLALIGQHNSTYTRAYTTDYCRIQ